MDQVEYFAGLVRILEQLFPHEWMNRYPNRDHPAVKRWNLGKRMVQQEGYLHWPEQASDLADIARMALDASILVDVTGGDAERLRLGKLSAYAADGKSQFFRDRLVNPSQFDDVMVELAVGAWYVSEGYCVQPLEQDNGPDLRIDSDDLSLPYFLECKNLTSISYNRINSTLRKANKQLRGAPASNGYHGLAIIDVTGPVTRREGSSDKLPEGIVQTEKRVRRVLNRSKNRAVSACVILWDDWVRFGGPEEQRLTFALRRNRRIVHHEEPETRLPTEEDVFRGFTMVQNLTMSRT